MYCFLFWILAAVFPGFLGILVSLMSQRRRRLVQKRNVHPVHPTAAEAGWLQKQVTNSWPPGAVLFLKASLFQTPATPTHWMTHHSGTYFSFSSLPHPYIQPGLTPALREMPWWWTPVCLSSITGLVLTLMQSRESRLVGLMSINTPGEVLSLEIQNKLRYRVVSHWSLGEYSLGSSSLIWGVMTEGMMVIGGSCWVFWEMLL